MIFQTPYHIRFSLQNKYIYSFQLVAQGNYLLSENQGVSCARNIGIEQAIGKYICFIDSDDYIMPDALEKFKKSIDAMPYSDLYIGNIVPFVDMIIS